MLVAEQTPAQRSTSTETPILSQLFPSLSLFPCDLVDEIQKPSILKGEEELIRAETEKGRGGIECRWGREGEGDSGRQGLSHRNSPKHPFRIQYVKLQTL